MTQTHRLPGGGEIDRGRTLSFTFEGRRLDGHPGDTVASALLANGVRLVGRGFKYHRPRGLFAAGYDEPNAILDLRLGDRHDANARATQVPLAEGMVLAAVNAEPDLRRDKRRVFDRFWRFLPGGFYYKTFMRPSWHAYEPAIRAAAGLGRVDPTPDETRYEQQHGRCDLLVVGAGPAGLAAARAAAAAGRSVWLVENEARPGGQLLWRDERVEDLPGAAWAAAVTAELAALPNVRVFLSTQAYAYYDHNTVALLERRAEAAAGWAPERLWLVRAERVVLATGAIERPLVFPDNDRPGVMSLAAAATYLGRWAVLPGRRVVAAVNNDDAYASAFALARAGAEVLIADVRDQVDPALAEAARALGVTLLTGRVPHAVLGRDAVDGVRLGPAGGPGKGETFGCDLLAVSGGWSPTVHLFSQSGGKLRYDEALACFLPDRSVQREVSVGAARGSFALAAALAEGHAAGEGSGAAPRATRADRDYAVAAYWRAPLEGTRQWLDFQNDVTTKDVELAAREGYVSVEHLKRYTTLGMATDQGKTSNVNGLAVLGEVTGRAPGAVGTTTFRPPFTPVSLGAIAGLRRGDRLQTRRLSPLHQRHLSLGAEMRNYGLWSRPACYPRAGESAAQAIAREVLAVRRSLGLFDGSSLGKIEVTGPDAAEFVNRLYYNELKTLKPGRLRYCLQLSEGGSVYDDGVVARLAPNQQMGDRYLLSPSTSHVDGVMNQLELWHDAEWPHLQVYFHNATQAWATLAVSGPRARELVALLDSDLDLSDAALPHMALVEGLVEGVPARVARVSFTGERSYEISVPALYGQALWDRLTELGAFAAITPYGIESLMTLRTEKGYILIGRDTDAETQPQDLGVLGPLRGKTIDYVGRRSLFTPEAKRDDRRQLIGLAVVDSSEPLPTGAHVIVPGADGKPRSLGYVTSSYPSPTLGRPVALGLVQRGRALVAEGAELELYHLGRRLKARAVEPCFYDLKGAQLNA